MTLSKIYISKKDLRKRMRKDLKWVLHDYGFNKAQTERIMKKLGNKFLKETIESEF